MTVKASSFTRHDHSPEESPQPKLFRFQKARDLRKAGPLLFSVCGQDTGERFWHTFLQILHLNALQYKSPAAESFPAYESRKSFHAEPLLLQQAGLILPGEGHHLADQPLVVDSQLGIGQAGSVLCHHGLFP